MANAAWKAFLAVCIAALPLATTSIDAQAQEAATEGTTRLDLSFETARPGDRVTVSIILKVPASIKIGTTINEITFPHKLLTFERVTQGLSADLATAMVSANVKADERDPEKSIVTVTVTGKKGDAIPGGVVANLAFKVSEQAPLEQSIALDNKASAFTAEDLAQPVDPIAGRSGEIKIAETAPVIFSCFFYMH
ncbi:MAG: hypothetical protein HY644_12210 [Acidobacteria bacterium]|nr:hypothetical protein [Acidobacteriota bacterium]